MKIIFMGTSQFACPALESLIANSDFEIVAVYTKEPKVAGRGKKIQYSVIHEAALKNKLTILTPKNFRSQEEQKRFYDFNADAAIVVSYGLILPVEILSGTKRGCFNIHPSLLPKWRGAAPIQHTIISGDKETAVSIIKMDSGIDSGDVVCEEKFLLDGDETYSSLLEKTSILGAKILIKTFEDLYQKEISPTKQNDSLATYAKKIEKSECKINWQCSAEEIERKIRGLNGYNEAFFDYDGEKIKVFSAQIIENNSTNNVAGKILDKDFSIQCGKGIIRPKILQREGRKPIAIRELLCGFRLELGKILE